MNQKFKQASIRYLQSVVDCDPQMNPQKMGECFYCEAALNEGEPHNAGCHYLKAKELLREFKG